MPSLLKVEKIFSNGLHNAFTDIAFWKGYYYLAFRTGTAHSSPDGRITVIRSRNLEEWEHAATLDVPGYDARDPKLLPLEKQLILLTPCRRTNTERDNHLFYTKDGENWVGPKLCGPGCVVWRRHKCGDKIYLCAYKVTPDWSEGFEVHLMESEDGLNWNYISTVTRGRRANETELLKIGGEFIAFIRTESEPRTMLVCTSSDKRSWNCRDTGRIIQGPLAFTVGGEIYIAGRYYPGDVFDPWKQKVGIFAFDRESLSFKHVLDLPNGGDSSYPGIVSIGGDRYAMSYYSSHEQPEEKKKGKVSDIYLAILEF